MSESTAHASVLAGCRRFLKPIVSFLLRTGVGYREFNDVVKNIFVQVASDEYGLRGRQTNVSRVAVMTGLTRKEVRRIRELQDAESPIGPNKRSPANQVLNYWHTDDLFQDSFGVPLDLPFEDGDISFMALAKKYGGDVPPIALLKELKRGRAVLETNDGKLRAMTRFFEPVEVDSQFVTVVSFSLEALASTITNNSKAASSEEKYLQRFVSNARISRDSIHEFKSIAEEGAEELLDRLDRWLTQNEIKHASIDSSADAVPRVGVGIYYFEIEGPTDLD
jgi:hypothetical protein